MNLLHISERLEQILLEQQMLLKDYRIMELTQYKQLRRDVEMYKDLTSLVLDKIRE